ncbi:MAG: stage 0 sporulation family protein [Firmicutes bacterium]|nr:stage 0 sporulation family protein [Bacillota bacterium]
MIEVVSIKFKNRGKSYFFSPNGLQIKSGDRVIVETAKGMEIAECSHGNHPVEDTAVVLPLRPVLRIATADDLRVAELNKKREKEAFKICQQKIEEHGLDMKLVDVECNFEGNKTMFFFTSDGRVDFRELVKDLASIFRNRIELRQIGVRDEAKMIGGIGICGRPYCCNQFLEEFQPVSTKMAKIQSLSLNPTKISGSCGRLMCCLRYEQEAYEELIKKVPKQGAFVETKDGYGTAVQVNLLRQTVKVRMDDTGDDSLHLFKANELAAVPGGRPKDGELPPHVLHYVPPVEEEEEEEAADEWTVPVMVVPEPAAPVEEGTGEEGKKRSRRRRGGRNKNKAAASEQPAQPKEPPKEQAKEHAKSGRSRKTAQGEKKGEQPARTGEGKSRRSRNEGGKTTVKPVKVEHRAEKEGAAAGESGRQSSRRPRSRYRGRP